MVEVFKTNVKCPLVAQLIMADILALFFCVDVSFDLEDKDCILRLGFEKDFSDANSQVQQIIQNHDCEAELLGNDFEFRSAVDHLVFVGGNVGIKTFLSIF